MSTWVWAIIWMHRPCGTYRVPCEKLLCVAQNKSIFTLFHLRTNLARCMLWAEYEAVIRAGNPLKKQSLPHAYAGLKAGCLRNTICVYSACVQKRLQTTDFKDVFVGLMGPRPSRVKTAPRKVVAVRLFLITEQVIYLCRLSSVFDTSLHFFGRLLLKAASHCLVCSPHRLCFRASSVDAGVWWGKERVERERERSSAFLCRSCCYQPFDSMNRSSEVTSRCHQIRSAPDCTNLLPPNFGTVADFCSAPSPPVQETSPQSACSRCL